MLLHKHQLSTYSILACCDKTPLLQVTLFAHSHYKSNWHSMYSLASNVRHVRWDRVPGFALMHQSGIWFEIFIRNSTLNIAGAVSDSVDTPCNQVSVS